MKSINFKYITILALVILLGLNIYLYKLMNDERQARKQQNRIINEWTVKEKELVEYVNHVQQSIGSVSVKSLGAIGDGKSDDTESIKLAINKIKDQGGGEIFLPQGTYLVSEPLEIPEGTTIKGESHLGTRILYTGSGFAFNTVGTHLRISFSDFNIYLANTGSGIKIGDVGSKLSREKGILPRQIGLNNISITGLKTGQYGIRLMNASHVNMTGVRSAYGSGGTGLSIWNDKYNSGVMTFNDCTFGRVNESDIGLEIDGENGSGLDSFSFNGTYFGGKNPIKLGKTVAVRNINFNGIHVEGNADSNLIQMYNVKGVSFSGVTLTGFGSNSNGFVFVENTEKVNIFGTEANHFFGNIYYNKGNFPINSSIIQAASLTGGSKPVNQFKGDFHHVTRLVGDRLAINNIQANIMYTDNGNKVDWGDQNPENDKTKMEGSLRGDIRQNTNPTLLGDKDKFIIEGWKCIESGNPGVWVELRVYTNK
jgi:hypothetical protein